MQDLTPFSFLFVLGTSSRIAAFMADDDITVISVVRGMLVSN